MPSPPWMFCWGLLALGACGCGGREVVTRVSGSVTLDGKPLAGATVTFAPREKKLLPNSAVTDERGAYQLTRHPLTHCLLQPGKYSVFVKKLVDKKGQPPTDTDTSQAEAAGELIDLAAGSYSSVQKKQGLVQVDIRPGDNEVPPILLIGKKGLLPGKKK